ncbi:MAG: type IV secretion system protein [Sphingomicrobium sp.]
MDFCSGPRLTQGFIGSTTHYIDCQAQALGSNAWHELAVPGSTLALVLSGFLTIFIALIGYNLLLGRSLTLRGGAIAMLKIGAVFTLATSWPAYRTLVYDLVVDGPAQLTADIGRPSAIPGSDGTLVERLDATDAHLAQLAIVGVGVGIADNVPPPPFAGFNAFALGGSRILYLITAVAGLGGVRATAGLMLALGPFFIAFLMFDSTRSLFEGWVRVLAGAALGAVGVSIALGFELAMLGPWLAAILARRMAGEDLPTVPVELFVLTGAFTLILLGVLFACMRVARAFRLPQPWQQAGAEGRRLVDWNQYERPEQALVTNGDERSRAAAVADILVSLQRREDNSRGVTGPLRMAGAPPSQAHSAGFDKPLGHSFSRRARPRVSASAGKRDILRDE